MNVPKGYTAELFAPDGQYISTFSFDHCEFDGPEGFSDGYLDDWAASTIGDHSKYKSPTICINQSHRKDCNGSTTACDDLK